MGAYLMQHRERREPQPFWVPIGRRLKELRLGIPLTQRQVAYKLGVSHKMISNYENGLSAVPTEYFKEYAAILHCSVMELFGDSERSPVSDNIEEWLGFLGRDKARLPDTKMQQIYKDQLRKASSMITETLLATMAEHDKETVGV